MKDAFGKSLKEGMTVIHSVKTSCGTQYSIAKITKIIPPTKHPLMDKIELKIIKSTDKDKRKENIVVYACNVMKMFDV